MEEQSVSTPKNTLATSWSNVTRRRSFLTGIGAAAAVFTAGELAARDDDKLSRGDVAILQFLAAAELVESVQRMEGLDWKVFSHCTVESEVEGLSRKTPAAYGSARLA